MTRLVLGPVLRHVGSTDATVWVETDGPCTVEVLGHTERTWCVHGHHYALVQVAGLTPGSTTPYAVRLDGRVVWPLPEGQSTAPASTIRTLGPGRPLRLAFGSCRYATQDAVDDGHFDKDALDAYALWMMTTPDGELPDALLLLGDQVYADETSREVRAKIRARRDLNQLPGSQVRDFEEYTWLYHESWSDPRVRWLLSTLPSSMIFDDHDVHDDWNTSGRWRREKQATDWWQERIIGALSSYWVYQHLGNLSPAALAQDELYQRVRSCEGDAEALLRPFAVQADAEADGRKGARWSYRRDLGDVRLLVVDSRCGRILHGIRSMLSDEERAWIEQQLPGDYDHLLVGTSLPWLLPRALHDLESWNEALADGGRGRRIAAWSERLRRTADLEHWAAFRASFDWLVEQFEQVGTGRHGRPPATVCVLSGDVHHAYAAQAHFRTPIATRVYQLTCSPLHNYVPAPMKLAFGLSWSRLAEKVTRLLLSLISTVPPMPIHWSKLSGPHFGDQIATLTLNGRSAEVVFEQAITAPDGEPGLRRVLELTLALPRDGRARHTGGLAPKEASRR